MHTFDIKATFFMKPTRVICAKNGGKCFATCGLEGGRVGRVRRGGHLIFKKKMPVSFAHGRYRGHFKENLKAQSMRYAP